MRPIFTPSTITALADNEIFVFGSNIKGFHSGGASGFARKHFGAIEGQSEGRQGQCYAIPTVGLDLNGIKVSVETFCKYAKDNPELKFLVTPIGCKNAGYTPEEIAPFFKDAYWLENVILPKSFAIELSKDCIFSHYNIEYGDFLFDVVDVSNNKVVLHSGPVQGMLPREIEFNGDVYELVPPEKVKHSFQYRDLSYPAYPSGFFGYQEPLITGETNYLGKTAFFFTFSPHEFHIPEGLEHYGAAPFPHCPIVSHSERFMYENGLVIDKKYKRVVQCIDYLAEHVKVPDGIEEIHDGAFFKCNLKSISLPPTLKTIGVDAFWFCESLESIVLPKSVNYIGDYCFSHCLSLKSVTFKSENISFGENPFHRCDAKLYGLKSRGLW